MPYEVIDAPRTGQVVRPASAAASPAPASTPVARRRANETLLASIVASIEVPASELEPRPAAPPPRQAPAATARTAPAVAPRTPSAAALRTLPAAALRTGAPKAVEERAALAAAKSAARDRSAKADATKSDAAKPKNPAEPKKKPEPAKAETARWWVQIAGGARASDLDKDWKRLSEKSAALKGKGAYVTPLRATNRLLTGPFKTEAEARGVVNALAKEGKPAFTFQSAAGQKVDRLGGQ